MEATLTHEGLNALWVRLRLEFLLCAQGGTANLDKHTAASKPESKAPPPAGQDLRALENRWDRCKTTKAQREVLGAAIDQLRTYKFPNPDPRARRGTQEWRVVIATDPRSSRVVARMYGVSHETVCEYRRRLEQGRI